MWQIIRVDKNNGYVDLEDKVKFKCGEVVLSTLNQKEAMDLLLKYVPSELRGKVGYQVVTSGYGSTINSGCYSTINSGCHSTINSGDNSIINSGDESIITSEYKSNITSGRYSTITSGVGSIITSGNYSKVVIDGGEVTFTLGKGSRVMTTSSIFVEGIDFNANEEVIVKKGKIIKGD